MTALYWLLTAVSGGLVAGVVRLPLRVEERVALAVVTGVLGSAVCALGLATVFGVGEGAALGGPVLLGVIAVLALLLSGGLFDAWRESIAEVPERWRSHELMMVTGVAVAAVAGFSVLFAHTLFSLPDGSIASNVNTVWADWSMHATTASNFALGHNLPPSDPIFSGTTLLYPFLADWHAGMLVSLGSGIGAALAVPSALMCVAIALLMVSIARRLTGSVIAGVLAMAMCMLGGSLGAEGLYWDACTGHGATASQCAPSRFVTDPVGAVGTAFHTIGNLPGAIAAQGRPYDSLLADPSHPAPLSNVQWYTPLLAWWLPQRPFLFGFAAVLSVFLIVLAARGSPGRRWAAFAVAGMLWGILPLVHVHSFIALVILMPLLAVWWRRREWLVMLAVAAVMATPRLAQLALSDEHGVAALGNTFPWLEPGWMSGVIQTASTEHRGLGVGNVFWAVGNGIRAFLTPQWWGFWIVNCGIVLPLMAVVAVAAALRHAPPETRVHAVAARVSGLVPRDLLRFSLAFLAVFALCNLVVFQSWDWDNTKLFAYWYFGASLLVGGLVVALWRRAWWLKALSATGYATVIMTGTVVMLRFMPWTPSNLSNAGPFVWESPYDQSLAAQVERRTAPDAVILTNGVHTDPLLTLAGRRTVAGYTGWLWSYGIDYRARQGDVAAMFAGCAAGETSCAATELMRRYHVSYVEFPPDLAGQIPAANRDWWSALPVVARVSDPARGDVVVYDVRGVAR